MKKFDDESVEIHFSTDDAEPSVPTEHMGFILHIVCVFMIQIF